jgi:hypothetical protein
VPMPLRDADALSEPSRVAFAWDRIWVVHDDATAMTSIDRPRSAFVYCGASSID